MARAHSLLAATAWRGGMLETLAKDELAPYAERARVSGPAVQLAAEAVEPMAMVLHEMGPMRRGMAPCRPPAAKRSSTGNCWHSRASACAGGRLAGRPNGTAAASGLRHPPMRQVVQRQPKGISELNGRRPA